MACSKCEQKRRRMHQKLVDQGIYTHRELRIMQRKKRIAMRNKRIKIRQEREKRIQEKQGKDLNSEK